MWNIDPMKIQVIFEKRVIIKGDHIQEWENKKEVKKVIMVDPGLN
jgi:hypothetical protein